MTPGMYTSEFILTLVLIVFASVLLFLGSIDQDTWKWVVSLTGGGYAISRGLAKTDVRRP